MTDITKLAPIAGLIASGELVKSIYEDSIGDTVKLFGTTLSAVIDAGLGPIRYPVQLHNEKQKIKMAVALEKYKRNLLRQDEDNLRAVPSEIAQPILEAFTYVTNEDLSNAYISLLTTASINNTAHLAHPSFVRIIQMLSPDEAKILKYLWEQIDIPYYRYGRSYLDAAGYKHLSTYLCGIEEYLQLDFPDTLALYFDNLLHLGLIVVEKLNVRTNVGFASGNIRAKRTALQKLYKDVREKTNKIMQQTPTNDGELIASEGQIYLTELGRMFITACLQ